MFGAAEVPAKKLVNRGTFAFLIIRDTEPASG